MVVPRSVSLLERKTMRSIVLAMLMLLVVGSVAPAQDVIVTRRATVVVQSAQDAAIVLARRGALVHTGCGQTEGIGFSSVSAQKAISNSCYWGKRTPLDIGVARGARGWYAVVRYR
jgi:hypothetical protein